MRPAAAPSPARKASSSWWCSRRIVCIRATLKPHAKTADDGWLQAWDPVARKMVWETPRGPRATSGVLATGGNLVFMGNSNGKQISAYNAKNGDKLWTFGAAYTAVCASKVHSLSPFFAL